MSDAPPDTNLLAYGILAGTARMILPPVIDLPFVRAVRGAMLDRLARAKNVTLSAEARRILVDLDDPLSRRGATEQAVRWAAGRFIPGAAMIDTSRNVLRTYGAGALFIRYLDTHRPEPRDAVIDGVEAQRVQQALRGALHVVSIEHIKSIARAAQGTFRTLARAQDQSLVQRYGDAVVSTLADMPAAWLDALDRDFARALDPMPGTAVRKDPGGNDPHGA